MHSYQVFGALGYNAPSCLGSLLVGKMARARNNAILQVARVGAATEHGYIVVALKRDNARAGKRGLGLCGEHTCICYVANGVACPFKAKAHGVYHVV